VSFDGRAVTQAKWNANAHDALSYMVDADKCNFCMDCISPCPTGLIDNWRTLLRIRAYSLTGQFGWEKLPSELSLKTLSDMGVACGGRRGT